MILNQTSMCDPITHYNENTHNNGFHRREYKLEAVKFTLGIEAVEQLETELLAMIEISQK